MISTARQVWKTFIVVGFLSLPTISSCDEQVDEDYPGVFEDESSVDEDDILYQEEEYDLAPPQPTLADVNAPEDVLSDEQWDEITKGVSYKRTQKKKPREFPEPTPGFNFGKGFEKGLSTIAWVIVIALLIGFLAWLIIRTKVDTSVDSVRDFKVTDELLAASKKELADALTQNLNRQDYRAAIRYRFGQLLQAMRKVGLLIWVPGRTNAEYQSELKSPFFEPFGVLEKAFSYAMYSGREVNLADYEAFAEKADLFLALFSSLPPKPFER